MRAGSRVFLLSAVIVLAFIVPAEAVAGQVQGAAENADYVGAEACETCHSSLYKKYTKTAHTKKTQEALKKNVVMPVKNTMTSIDGKVMFKLRYRPDTRRNTEAGSSRLWITLYNLDGTNPIEYPVALVLGGGSEFMGKQRLIIEVDANGNGVLNPAGPDGQVTRLISPVQFNHHDPRAPEAWAPYHPEHWYNADGTLIGSSATRYSMEVAESQFKNSWERRCIGCHSTGTAVSFDKQTGMFINDGSEFNVWCEACHGPGSAHVASASAADIVNPVDWEAGKPQKALDICASCHIRGGNVGSGSFTTGYPAKVRNNQVTLPPFGALLAKWYTPGEGVWNSSSEEWGQAATETEFSKKHHQQGYDYIQSAHWTGGDSARTAGSQVFCWDCHDPHTNGVGRGQLRVSDEDNTLCLNCHTDDYGDVAAIQEHTQHSYDPAGSGTSRCSSCHMPRTAKSATWYNDHAGDISSHTFEVVPSTLTNKMARMAKGTDEDGKAIPNGCNACHADEDYGAARWRRWKQAGGGNKGR